MKQPELGTRISALRKQKGLTQDELVELCNINVRTLQRIESGEVTPRSYTIKTILSALDYDYESLQAENTVGQIPTINVAAEAAKSVHRLLTLAWVAGIGLLIAAVFEGIADYVRFDEGVFLFGQWGHLAIKLVALGCNLLLWYGFLICGKLLHNFLMKVTAVIMLLALICFYGYDMLSLFSNLMAFEVVFMAEAVSFGVLGVLFGIAILKSRPILGNTGIASGVAELVMAVLLLTVVLAPLALFFLIPVVLLEILVLYKVATMVKEQQL